MGLPDLLQGQLCLLFFLEGVGEPGAELTADMDLEGGIGRRVVEGEGNENEEKE
jgi:hypothetical protein